MLEPEIVNNMNYKSCTSGFMGRRSYNKALKEEKSRKSGLSQHQLGERRNTQTAFSSNRSLRDGLRSMLGGKQSGPIPQAKIVSGENDLQLQQEKIKNILQSTSFEHKNKLDGFNSQLDLNPVKHHRDLMQLKEGKTSLLDGHLADLPSFMAEKVAGRVNS